MQLKCWSEPSSSLRHDIYYPYRINKLNKNYKIQLIKSIFVANKIWYENDPRFQKQKGFKNKNHKKKLMLHLVHIKQKKTLNKLLCIINFTHNKIN